MVTQANQTFHQQLLTGKLKITQAIVTAENIGELVDQFQISDELDVLSLDIDRNTYWLWNALPNLRPRVVITEYNAQMPPWFDWKVPYDAQKHWNNTFYYGASLKAYELLGRLFQYSLVGCTLSGINAVFVRNDLCDELFEQPYTAEHHYSLRATSFYAIPVIDHVGMTKLILN